MNIAFNLVIPILVISPENNGTITQDTDCEVIQHRVSEHTDKIKREKAGGQAGGTEQSKTPPDRHH